MEPQGRVSDRSRSTQRKESPQRQKGKKTTAEVKKPSDLPQAKEHKPMDSDEEDEPVPVFPLQSGARGDTMGGQIRTTTSSQGHRPVQPRPVHKEHQPASVLRTNPLTMMTCTEKENLSQQSRVHGVMTQEGQCSTQTIMF